MTAFDHPRLPETAAALPPQWAAQLVYGMDFDHFRGWRVRVHPAGKQASGRYVTPPRLRPRARRTHVPLAERERNRMAAARRGRSDLCLYAVANGNTGLAVLTFRQRTTDEEAWVAAGRFTRQVRRQFGRFPWILTLERHYSGSAHLNLLLPPGDYRAPLSKWRHGFTSQPRNGVHPYLTPAEQARALVRYVTKDWDFTADQTPPKRHRYRTARGFAPMAIEIAAPTLREVHELLTAYFGEQPARFWSSRNVPDWIGPSTVVMQWR
jgi:hypothetical protein